MRSLDNAWPRHRTDNDITVWPYTLSDVHCWRRPIVPFGPNIQLERSPPLGSKTPPYFLKKPHYFDRFVDLALPEADVTASALLKRRST